MSRKGLWTHAIALSLFANLDSLAKNGLRYDHFHVTGLRSATRAALLSGRNHHSVHYLGHRGRTS